jgi:enamine deaminase RidA (YjgF/YER057c/UK114 family)
VAEGVEARLRGLGYELPTVPHSAGSYVPTSRTGALVFTAGQLPFREGQLLYAGKVDREISVEDAKEAARLSPSTPSPPSRRRPALWRTFVAS